MYRSNCGGALIGAFEGWDQSVGDAGLVQRERMAVPRTDSESTRAERDRPPRDAVVERPDPHRVAGSYRPPGTPVRQDERKIAGEMLDAAISPSRVSFGDDLEIAAGAMHRVHAA